MSRYKFPYHFPMRDGYGKNGFRFYGTVWHPSIEAKQEIRL
jgi:hypothetical protein